MASVAPLFPPVTAPRAVETDELADLALIYQPGVNLCVARRRITPTMSGFVFSLLSGARSFETELRFDGERPPVEKLLPEDLQALPGAEAWLSDEEYLAGLFRDLFEADALGLRLRTLDKAMCPRFHVDRVPVRMVCAYGGPGTKWLPEDAMNREKLGHGACGMPDEDSGLILDPGAVRSMPTFAVGLLKGERWEGNEGRGAVHRSPRPTPEQPRRLLLTLPLTRCKPMRIKLTGGRLYDPAQGWNGEVRDLFIEDGRIAADPCPDARFDAEYGVSGKIVMAGAIDIHSHIAGGNANTARVLLPEQHRNFMARRLGHPHETARWSTVDTGYRYARMGYTTVVEPAVLPANALDAHLQNGRYPDHRHGGAGHLGQRRFSAAAAARRGEPGPDQRLRGLDPPRHPLPGAEGHQRRRRQCLQVERAQFRSGRRGAVLRGEFPPHPGNAATGGRGTRRSPFGARPL
jgi:hypothetical protein